MALDHPRSNCSNECNVVLWTRLDGHDKYSTYHFKNAFRSITTCSWVSVERRRTASWVLVLLPGGLAIMQGWWREGRRTKWRYECPCLASHRNRVVQVRSETRVAHRNYPGRAASSSCGARAKFQRLSKNNKKEAFDPATAEQPCIFSHRS